MLDEVIKLSSTFGGFLTGFGLCLLLVSIFLQVIINQYYDFIKRIYFTTHSTAYEMVINALSTISPYTDKIADAIKWIPGLNFLSKPLKEIHNASNLMRELYDISTQAYGIVNLELPFYGIVISIVFIVAGVALIIRARKR